MPQMISRAFSLSPSEIQARFPQHVTEILGTKANSVSRVTSPDDAHDDCIVFCASRDALRNGMRSRAGILVLSEKDRASVQNFSELDFAGTILISPRPDVFLAAFLKALVLKTPYRDSDTKGRHSSAHVHPTAVIAPDAVISAGAVIARDVIIAAGAFIGAGSVIERGARIGRESVIHPLVYIGHSTAIGERCEIYPQAVIGKEGFGYATDAAGFHHKIAHQGIVVLEDDVHVGSNTTIDRGTFGETRIASGVKIDNQVHVAHNCKIGSGSLLTAGFMIAGSSEVGQFFVGGGRSSVTGHVKVGDMVRIAALAAVSKDVLEPGDYGGAPTQPLREHIKVKAAIAQLPEMRKQVARLVKKVFGPGEL